VRINSDILQFLAWTRSLDGGKAVERAKAREWRKNFNKGRRERIIKTRTFQ